jgi:3-hydroxy acid dehydrogenase / malonic semialdehyde reductase
VGSIIITGASSGFGRATARKIARLGQPIVLAARRLSRLEALAGELQALAPVKLLALDVRDRESVFEQFGNLPEPFSDVAVLVNNAGLALGLGAADEANMDDWETMVDTNIKGLMYCTRAILPTMVKNGLGHIINLGSVAASWPYPGGNVYGGSKAFVQQFSRNLRSDLVGKGIRVSNIEPGMCETEFSVVRFDGDEAKAGAVYDGMQPLSAEDIADLICWVISLPAHININQLEVMPVAQAWSAFAVDRGD